MKYAAAVMFSKKAEADVAHDRVRRRSTLLKHLLLAPITGGLPLIRHLFGFAKKDRAA